MNLVCIILYKNNNYNTHYLSDCWTFEKLSFQKVVWDWEVHTLLFFLHEPNIYDPNIMTN